jgi:hypothetical protein
VHWVLGLSIVFGGFVLVFLAELYYVFVWKRHTILNKRGCRIGTKCNGDRGNFAHELYKDQNLGWRLGPHFQVHLYQQHQRLFSTIHNNIGDQYYSSDVSVSSFAREHDEPQVVSDEMSNNNELSNMQAIEVAVTIGCQRILNEGTYFL